MIMIDYVCVSSESSRKHFQLEQSNQTKDFCRFCSAKAR